VETIILFLARTREGWTLTGFDEPVPFRTLAAGIRDAHARLSALRRKDRAGQLLVRRGDGAWEVAWAWEPEEQEAPRARAAGGKG